ncbi:hypothetical protein E2C01_014653 [Portunus trituberculatus]|uniref:Uncharacterized protein n=1 Tax=Portunus trituberculatus TaxID=210409 RepID=A0A5B7DJF6_PORTR|nr:hypothetical protein [Portunus trituberculatus]
MSFQLSHLIITNTRMSAGGGVSCHLTHLRHVHRGPQPQKSLIELECSGIPVEEVVDTVKPLQEHGTPLIDVLTAAANTTSVTELVAKLYPLSLNENHKALSKFCSKGQAVTERGPSVVVFGPIHLSNEQGLAWPPAPLPALLSQLP